MPLLAPALAEPATNYPWISTLLAGQHHDLVGISVHRYPYSACVPRPSRKYPTIARVLSSAAAEGVAHSVRAAVRVAAAARLPLRLTELNSVTCGGTRRVSDVFATALWAPDALFSLVRAGAASASIHVRARAINMAFEITTRGLVTHPLLYGMILFSRAVGPGSDLVATRLSTLRYPHLRAWAVRLADGCLRVLLINKAGASLTVGVASAGAGQGTLERLLAPSVRATAGVTLEDAEELRGDALRAGRARRDSEDQDHRGRPPMAVADQRDVPGLVDGQEGKHGQPDEAGRHRIFARERRGVPPFRSPSFPGSRLGHIRWRLQAGCGQVRMGAARAGAMLGQCGNLRSRVSGSCLPRPTGEACDAGSARGVRQRRRRAPGCREMSCSRPPTASRRGRSPSSASAPAPATISRPAGGRQLLGSERGSRNSSATRGHSCRHLRSLP